jgi:O-antigen ligase
MWRLPRVRSENVQLSSVNQRPIWPALVYVLLVLNITEGAMRKWLFPGSGQLLYFAKDAVLIIAYALFFFRDSQKANQHPRKLTFLYFLIALVVCLDAFNPNLGSPIVGIFGVKCYLLYVGLMYLGAELFNDWKLFQRFVRWQVILAIPICLLGVAQFGTPADSPLNRYAAGEEQIATFGADATVRITGTFAYITGHVFFVFISIALAVGLLGTSRRRGDYFVSIAALILCVGNVCMSGSRAGGLLAATLVLAILGWFGFRRNWVAVRLRTLLVIAIALVAFTTTTWFNKAYNAYLDRIENSDDEFLDRAFQHHDVFWQILDYAGLAGFGTGITHPGGTAIQESLHLKPSEPVPMFEAEYARVLVEIGWIGAALWYALRLSVLVMIWNVYRALRADELRCWAFIIFLVHLLTLNGAVVLNHSFAIYYWLLAGIAFGLPRLENRELQTQAVPAYPQIRPAIRPALAPQT